jgi:inner membrane protein
MASLGHIAVGMAAARIYRGEPGVQRVSWTAMLLWAALSFLPDADVIGFGLGVRYEDPWGHRGVTHSLMFALALGTTLGLAAPLFRRPTLRTAVTASLVLASHALSVAATEIVLFAPVVWFALRTPRHQR